MTISTFNVAGGPNSGVVLTGAVQAVQSKEILLAAQPVLRYAQFVEVKTELERQPGQQINFLRYNDLVGDPTLTESTDMDTTNLSSSQISITVSEYGFAVQVTEKLLELSFTDVMGDASMQLGRHYGKSLDIQIRNSLRGAPSIVRVGGAASRAALGTTDYLDMDTIYTAAETLTTNKAPKFDGDHYVCFVHPHQASKFRRTADFINVTNYGAPDRIYRGEIGRIDSVRFIETTQQAVIKSGAHGTPGEIYTDGVSDPFLTTEGDYHATADVYEAIMFGANAVGHAVALPVEMRDNGVEDYGRRHSLAWYSVYGISRIEDAHTVVIATA